MNVQGQTHPNQSGTPSNPAPGVTAQPAEAIANPPVIATNGGAPATQATSDDELPQGMQPHPKGVQVLSQSAFKTMKLKERERGKKDALATMAEAAGFSSVEEMQKAMATLKSKPPQAGAKPKNNGQNRQPQSQRQQPLQAQQTGNPHKEIVRLQREVQHLTDENANLRKQLARLDGKRKDLQQHIDAREAEYALREVAVLQGVKDVDYAIRLFTRAMEDKSEEELARINEADFFKGLRSEHPYIFGEVMRPATTGTGTGGPPAPKPGEATTTTAQSNQVDARKMKPEEFRDHLRQRGLNIGI